MKIVDLLSKETIDIKLVCDSKKDLIDKMVDLIDLSGNITNKEAFKKEIMNRENISTTGVGEGIAIPHAKSEYVKKATIAISVLENGINYDSIDNQDVDIAFMLAVPLNSDIHLDILSKLSSFLLDDNFINNLRNANTNDDLIDIIEKKENEVYTKREVKEFEILAVTSCPTGIAHTYMAEEALYKAANKKGITIKVETNGSTGVKNKLTEEEIEKCKAIIVAADKNVDMDRFVGRKVLVVNTASAIRKSEQLLDKIIEDDVPLYKSKNYKTEEKGIYQENGFKKIYKHLMNGVSHMLPFVIGGGILIAISFLIDAQNAGDPNFGSVNEIAKIFNLIGSYAFNFMLPILSAYIAASIADRPGLAVGFVGGYLATLPNASFITTIDGVNSGFLGAMVSGFLSGYIILLISYITRKLPKSLDGLKPTLIYPVLGILLIGLLMYFVINAPFAYLNNLISNVLNSLSDVSIVILGAVLAGMMSIDMGGPINKAAYVFGTAAISSGNYAIMAPVMIGGMIPPLVIALTSTFFPHKFTKKERTDGKLNYVMGLSFITEGAIPFAASDPWRVILSCVAGSIVAGGLCAFFGCTLMAPHGGIFVVAVMNKPLFFLLSLLVGSIVGTVVLGLIKKPVSNPELGKFKGIYRGVK